MSYINEAFEKYSITEKNTSKGNFKFLVKTIEELDKLDKVLLLTCSNRFNWDPNNVDIPKSTILGMVIQEALGNKATLIDVPELNIVPCEGNVSRKDGNSCGVKKALLKDDKKNPSGYHRCWASIHNPDDELWKISKELFESDCVIFFSSIRWGSANMFYQKIIERLNWINNRFVPYNESNVVKDIYSGFICVGQLFNADNVCELQMYMHNYFGFKVDKKLYWYWMCEDIKFDEETLKGYIESYSKFYEDFRIEKK
jgi:multimeric flavodoxin WrbA